ncbi:MAG: M48 family metalloprotease [Kofleriaceae bacterium]
MADNWLRDHIENEFVIERGGWAVERVARVLDRLQPDAPPAERFEAIVFWAHVHGAFTGAGSTIYVSRRLLERLPDDEAVAFVMAHEIAHHRLGHVPNTDWWAMVPARVAIALLRRQVCGPEDEREADLLAIEMCVDAGYDVERAIVAFDVLRQVSLDYGDVEGAVGTEHSGIGRWLRQRRRGYLSLAERIAAVRAHAKSVAVGQRLQSSTREQRDSKRRTRMAVAAGALAVAAALAVLRRRR